MKKVFFISLIILIALISFFTNLNAQTNVVIANVSVSPIPFSPDGDGQRDDTTVSFYLYYTDNIVDPELEIIIYRNNDINDVVKNINGLIPLNGLNHYLWDGRDNNNAVVNDGSYGVSINFIDGNGVILANHLLHNGIIVNTRYPEIEVVSTSPNPFSPNDDGFQDVHTIRYKVKDTQITYIGLIRFDFSDSTAVYEDGPYSIPTDGVYLFVNRPSSKSADITIPANMLYTLTLEGFETDITRGRSLYKLGQNYQRVFSMGSNNIAFNFVPDSEESFNQGIDYLAVYGVSGNMSFNINENDGTPLSYNDLYHNYYGSFRENHLDHTDVLYSTERNYLLNVGKNPGQFPGQNLEDGRYLYRIIVSNEVETAIQKSGEFIVNNNPIQISGFATPDRISPQLLDGYFDTTIIQYSPTEDAFISVKIWDADNNLVRNLVQNQLNTAGNGNYVLWDGKDHNNNVVSLNASAVFQVEITAVDRFINDDIVSIRVPVLVDNLAPLPAVLNQTEPDSLNTPTILISGISNEVNCEIILIHNNVNKGVVANTPQLPGYFEFPVTLEEGENYIKIRLRDSVYNLGLESNTVYYFLDSQSPVVENIFPSANHNFSSLPMTFRAYVSDDGVGVKHVRFGFSFNNNPNLSWITAVKDSTNHYRCTITATHPQFINDPNQVSIAMYVNAVDSLNNSVTTETPVTYNYFKPTSVIPPSFVSSYPENLANIRVLSNNRISVIINSEIPLVSNESVLVLTNGIDSLYHNHGAVFSQNSIGNNNELALNLANPLTSDGSDDFLYSIYYFIKTEIGHEKEGIVSFNYDTQKPFITETKINNSLMLIANNQTYFSTDIDSVSIYLNDVLSGINFAPNMTRVSLLNSANQVISGTRSFNKSEKRITWRLNQPLSVNNSSHLGIYTIQVLATDNAGNVLTQNKTFRLINPTLPQITEHIPQANTNINQLANNRITKKVLDSNGFGLDRTNTSIVLTNSENNIVQGNISFVSLGNNLYNVNFNLTNPLSLNGTYTVASTIIDTLGQQVTNSMTFTFDNQAPIASNALIGGTGWESALTNNSNYNQNISFVKIDFNDATSGVNYNSASSYVRIHNSNNQLMSGLKIVEGNTIRWQLNNPILSDGSMDGLYLVSYSAEDYSNNLVSGSYSFRVTNPFSPQVNQINPLNNSIINILDSNKILISFSDERGIDVLDFENNFIKLRLPNNNIIQHGAGANQVISHISNHDYQMELSLNQPLTINGNYIIELQIQNQQGYQTITSSGFLFDNQIPVIENIVLGLSNGTEQIVVNNNMVYSGVNYIKVFVSDITSGVNYNSTNTNITVYVNGSPLDGVLEKFASEGYMRYTFLETLNQVNSNVSINTNVVDFAGNIKQGQLTFILSALNANIISVSPSNNSYINTDLNQVKLVLEYPNIVSINQNLSYLRLRHPDGTFIENGQGATISYTNINNRYEVVLNLNQPLAANGQDDGIYQISALLVTDLGQDGPISFNFTYDRQTPYFENLRVNDIFIANSIRNSDLISSSSIKKSRSQVIVSEDISYVQVNYSDITTAVNFASNLTSLTLINPNGNLVQGTRIVNGNNVSWVLNNPIIADGSRDGVYTLQIKATDLAGNTLTHSETFTLLSQVIPAMISYTPENVFGYYVNQFTQTVTANFRNTVPVLQDPSETYIRLVFPNGYVAQANQGATLSYQLEQNSLKVIFNLVAPLSVTGENDGQFEVQFRAKNITGTVFEESMTFIYDTTAPFYSSLSALSGNMQIPVSVNGLITESIDAVQVKFNDLVSGIHYAPNITYISLLDRNQNLIPGVLSYVSEGSSILTKWTLNSQNIIPLDGSSDGIYTIKLMFTDNSGNSVTQMIPFNVVSVVTPHNVVSMIDAVYIAHIAWSGYSAKENFLTKKIVEEKTARSLGHYEVYRKYNDEDFVLITQTINNNITDNLFDLPDGNYQYRIRAVYVINNQILYSAFAYSDIMNLNRYIACSFTITLQNNQVPSNILFHLFGNDGLYNQSYNIITDNSGVVLLPEVYKNTYILTLSKEGYHTIVDTIVVSDTNYDFEYVLDTDVLLMSLPPVYTALYQNFPNPFNPSTQIKFAIKNDSRVNLAIFNVKGQKVKQLIDNSLKTGYHKIVWNGVDESERKVASGVYFYVLEVKNENEHTKEIKKMILMK